MFTKRSVLSNARHFAPKWLRKLCTNLLIALCATTLLGGVAPALAQQDQLEVPARLSLQDALQFAQKNNPTLQRERQNLAIASANLTQARQLPNPNLDVNSESYPLFESNKGSFWNNQELSFREGQTIETAGKRSKRTSVAQHELRATGSDVLNTEREIILEVKQRYYAVVLAKAQFALANDILKQFDEIIRLNEARFKQGESSGLEMNRVRAERLRFYTDVLDSRLQLDNSRTALLEVLGSHDLTSKFDVIFSYSQPVELRMQELIAGVRSDVAITLYGTDLDMLRQKADEIVRVVSQIKGAADVKAEQTGGQPYLRVNVKRDQIARYGINTRDVLDAIEAIGGKEVGQVLEGQKRFALQVRFQSAGRDGIEKIGNLKVADPQGRLIPISQLADLLTEEGPAQISRTDIQRRISVEANVRGRDLSSFIKDAQTAVGTKVSLPSGYWITWGGQFEAI